VLPRHWRLAAFALLLPLQAWAQADTFKEYAQLFRQGRLLDAFGKWEIREGLIGKTYLLIGESARDGESYFWLHCDQNNLITVAVPLLERSESWDRLRSHPITIRSDTGLKRAMSLIVFENFVAVAIDYKGGRNANVAGFLEVLRAAKETVTIAYAQKSFDYDVTQLPAARARFQELCSRAAR
jgi:hypothetical protein